VFVLLPLSSVDNFHSNFIFWNEAFTLLALRSSCGS
jgi:hypothetical protein